MLEIRNLNVIFNQGEIEEKEAIKDLNLKVETGDFITIIGSNGAGKSTLFNAISGNIELTSGQILLEGKDITYMKDYKRSKVIGRLYQDPYSGTAPSMTIAENLGLSFSRGKKQGLQLAISKDDKKFFQEKLKKLNNGLDERMNTKVKLLSGGQRQSLTLLMSTIVTPKVLLLDEHTAALDPKTSIEIMNLTKEIIEENKITTLMITHNIEDALNYGNKTIVMNKGQIILILDEKQKAEMTIEDILKLYNQHLITVSDVNVLKE